MAHMRTQIDLLTKHIVSKYENVNDVGQPNRYEDQDINLDEESNYLGNQEGFWNYNSGIQGYNSRNVIKTGKSGSSSESKLEDMLSKVLQKVESTNAGVKEIEVYIPLVEAPEQMPGYAKFMKDLVTKNRAVSIDLTNLVHNYSAIATRSLVKKKEDLGAFTIPCTIRSIKFAKALCDLRASINLMPLAIYKKLRLGVPKPTSMKLMMADRLVKRHEGIICDVLVKVDTFIFSADFMILDCEVYFEVPIILGRPFLATGQALVDVERGELKFRINKEEVNFNICRSMKQPQDMNVVSAMEVFDEEKIRPTIEDRLAVETLAVMLMNFETDFQSDYIETMNALHGMGTHSYAPNKLNLDLKNRPSPPTKPSLEEPPVLELKQLPNHLRDVFFGTNNTLPMILAADLNDEHV
ncbi:uncharacterized protein LOC125857353 [Solanum stenotomum]|uniref:uncharacterized protein LOC125857353 n=1 Tax=Solanum stenotomum TaxID=172797 RepID=UPI0020D116A5|nr:uncharacterized protein LOC125857353 [Solanum stenotomum]